MVFFIFIFQFTEIIVPTLVLLPIRVFIYDARAHIIIIIIFIITYNTYTLLGAHIIMVIMKYLYNNKIYAISVSQFYLTPDSKRIGFVFVRILRRSFLFYS